MPDGTPTIDVQVHAYERNSPQRPWAGSLPGPDEVTGNDMVAAMDAVGVDGAILVSPASMYRYDASYALEAYAKHPTRFGLVKPFDPSAETVAEEIAAWAATPGVVGARLMLAASEFADDDPGLERMLTACAEAELTLNVLGQGKLPLTLDLARRHPDTRIVIDHLGLAQPFEPPVPAAPWADLDNVLALATCDNVAIKISGACTLAHEPYPYPDIWAPLQRIFDAFGFARCMWGTDWTRSLNFLTYEQGVEAFRLYEQLSDAERAALMGESLAKIYGWSPGP